MAVSFIAEAHNSFTSAGTGGTLTINKPTGTVDGDVMLAHFQSSDAAGTVATLAGWTLKASDLTVGNGASYLFWKVASSEGASYAWSIGGVGGSQATMGAIVTVRGASITTPFDQQSKNVDTTSDTTANGTAITPTMSPDCLLLAFTGVPGAAVTFSAHAVVTSNPTWTEAYDQNISGGGAGIASIVCAYANRNFITSTGTFTATISSAAKSTTYLCSIKPAAFAFSAAFAATLAMSGTQTTAMTPFTGTFTLTATIGISTVTQADPDWANEDKHSAVWVNEDKS